MVFYDYVFFSTFSFPVNSTAGVDLLKHCGLVPEKKHGFGGRKRFFSPSNF